MAIYIKPPKGDIGFNKLCEFVKKRILFLHFLNGKSKDEICQGIIENDLASYSECLIEGTNKDRISHFVLRCLCLGHHELESYFIQTETQYFQYRLEFYDLPGILSIVHSASKEVLQLLHHQHIIKPYKKALNDFLQVASELDLAIKYKSNLRIPFTAALKFVRERTLPLKSGFIEVPLEHSKQLLTFIFEDVIHQGLQQMKFSNVSHVFQDPRMHYMHKEVKRWFCAKRVSPSMTLRKNVVLERNLNAESKKFPLCMKTLYYNLCKTHRLPHSSRVQFILFLKEIGVPLHETIALFMKEYSSPIDCEKNGNKNKCLHSWDKDKQRYIYSIEHLYGQRGSKKNYSAHSCKSLQSLSNCPFVHFQDAHSLKNSQFFSCEVEDIEDIKVLSIEKKYSEACQCYVLKNIKDSSVLNEKNSSKSSCCSNFSATDSDNNDFRNFKMDVLNSVSSRDLVSNSVITKPSDVFYLLSHS